MPRSVELEVCELTKRYSPQVSVGPITFEVYEGEFFSLLGPSGCGKTTTLRCIAGFERLSHGSIKLHGRLGKTSIYVTHDQTEALALSDRIAVLSHGRIEQIGTPGDIYERPATAFVAEFIGSSNMLRARIVEGVDSGTIVVTEAGLRLCCRAESNGMLDDGADVSVLL